MRRILHLVGSPTDDFYADLSRLYARDCLQATADATRYQFFIAHVSPDRRWCFPDDLDEQTIAGSDKMGRADAVRRITSLNIDAMVPQMFCITGMTEYRSLFDGIGIPFVGNTATAMATTADKSTARELVEASGVKVPDGEVLGIDQSPSLMPPVVVKPVDADNSLGVTFVQNVDEFPAALRDAFRHSDRVLVERYVELGREVRCGVIARHGALVCLPIEEYAMDADVRPVRSPADKLARNDDDQLRLVAKDRSRAWMLDETDPITPAVNDAAMACFDALGCRHYGLFDFRIDPDGTPWFLEAGLYCSFAEQSVISMMARAAGVSLDELFSDCLDEALGCTEESR